MSVRGPALRNTDLRSRQAHMKLAVAHATIPPRPPPSAVGRRPGREAYGPAWTPESLGPLRAARAGRPGPAPSRPGPAGDGPHAPIPPGTAGPWRASGPPQRHPRKADIKAKAAQGPARA